MTAPPTHRGTTNRNARGSSYDRATRRRYLLRTHGDGTTCACWRCGAELTDATVTSDRIVPGCEGGTYRRSNLRPACAACNSALGGQLGATRPRKETPMPMTDREQRIEAAAQLLHERRHRAGSAPVCGSCRDAARDQLDTEETR